GWACRPPNGLSRLITAASTFHVRRVGAPRCPFNCRPREAAARFLKWQPSIMNRFGWPLRVLVVEDEFLIRWAIAETPTRGGCVVTEGGDGASALSAAASGTFDAVILDYRLPDSNDLKLLEALRDKLPRSIVVMMSAFGTPEILREARALGVRRFLDKPFE